MSKINVCLKLWSDNTNILGQVKKAYDSGLISFIEVYVVPDSASNIPAFEKLEIPVVLHSMHLRHGFIISKKELLNSNYASFKEVSLFSKKLGADRIVVHAGYGGTYKTAINCLDKISSLLPNSKFINVENMPKVGIDGSECLGYTAAGIKKLLRGKYSFCLDFAHCYKAAIALKAEPKKLVKDFLALNPSLFHLSGAGSYSLIDEHLNLFDSRNELDLGFIKRIIAASNHRMVTFETPRRDQKSIAEDINNIDFFNQV